MPYVVRILSPAKLSSIKTLLLAVLIAAPPQGRSGLHYPTGVALDGRGQLYVADAGTQRIYKVGTRGALIVVAGTGAQGFAGDGGLAVKAKLSMPHDLAFDARGNLYFADTFNHRIRKIDARGIITTVAGSGQEGYAGDHGSATQAALNNPQGLALDRDGNLLIADTYNHVLRRVDTRGIITTLAGTAPGGYGGDGGPASKAVLSMPTDLAIAPDGAIYFTDSGNSRIRRIDARGHIHNVIGFGHPSGVHGAGFKGDGEAVEKALIFTPAGLVFDAMGNLYFSDSGNSRIRAVRAGRLNTIAGTGVAGFSGDGGLATNAQISAPQKLLVDKTGAVIFADKANRRVRKITPEGLIKTIAGGGSALGYIFEPQP